MAVMLAAMWAGCGTSAPEPVVVAVEPGGAVAPVDPEVAAQVVDAVNQLATTPAEPPTAADQAVAVDPAKLLGTWSIVNTVGKIDGKAGDPAPPLVPTTWTFDPNGGMRVQGGMSFDAAYVYSGTGLVVTGMGPRLDYRVDRLTGDELDVTGVIEAGSLKIENTTVLKRQR